MFCRRAAVVLGCGTLFLLAGGCAPKRQPAPIEPQVTSAPAPLHPEVTLAAALQANRLGRWVYLQRDTSRDDAPARRYIRVNRRDRMAEGILAGREFLPLEQYFRPTQPATGEPGERRTPPPPLKGGTAFMFDLIEPLEAIPVDIRPGVPRIESSPVTYYDYDGKYLSHGTITREVEFEGIEDVECPAGRFVACSRVRVNLALRIPWIVSMDWSSWLWLSPQVGEVRRLEHMSGLFLIFLYSSSHEYVLASYAPVGATMDCGLDVAPHWTTGAVVLSRAIPRPEIAGMVVDYDTGTTSAAVLAPADDADAMPASRE